MLITTKLRSSLDLCGVTFTAPGLMKKEREINSFSFSHSWFTLPQTNVMKP